MTEMAELFTPNLHGTIWRTLCLGVLLFVLVLALNVSLSLVCPCLTPTSQTFHIFNLHSHPSAGSTGELTWNNYYRNRDVERVPKALRKIHDALAKNNGGVLTLDSDLPDTYMNSVFMMDYLVETSGFKLVSLNECIAASG